MDTFPKLERGQRVRLVQMDDKSAPPIGTLGTVTFCNIHGDWAQVGVKWENGSSLMVVLPHDEIEIVK